MEEKKDSEKNGSCVINLLFDLQGRRPNLINDILIIAAARERGLINKPVKYDFDKVLAYSVIDDLANLIIHLAHKLENHLTKEEMQRAFAAIFKTDIAPLVRESIKRNEQLHAPKEKRNKYILKHCRELTKEKPSTSAERLLNRFPEGVDNAVEINGALIFKDWTKDGLLKAYCITPDNKTETVSLRKFQNYFKEKTKKRKKVDL